jgi:hypothetical protein
LAEALGKAVPHQVQVMRLLVATAESGAAAVVAVARRLIASVIPALVVMAQTASAS